MATSMGNEPAIHGLAAWESTTGMVRGEDGGTVAEIGLAVGDCSPISKAVSASSPKLDCSSKDIAGMEEMARASP